VAAAILYVLYSYYKDNPQQYNENPIVSYLHNYPAVTKLLFSALGVILAYIIAIRLHINIKLIMFPLAAAILYSYFALLSDYYKKNTLQYGHAAGTVISVYDSSSKKTLYSAVGIALAFIIAFELHIKSLMYPLAAAIFYLYVPLLYLYGKKSMLQYARHDGPVKYYACLWFLAWFIITCFFSYMLSHLLADVISSFHWSFFRYLLYLFILLITGGLGIFFFLQCNIKKIDALDDIRTNFEKQGRLAGFEILFLLLVFFLLKH
jgi:hypothetical protein